jgi:hypothetical protein
MRRLRETSSGRYTAPINSTYFPHPLGFSGGFAISVFGASSHRRSGYNLSSKCHFHKSPLYKTQAGLSSPHFTKPSQIFRLYKRPSSNPWAGK